jgi:nitroimidazol reductase NimA-like FMN-containing flavoprotein (pyridoxamine 5'-phosphate oxidase superfamily)
MLEDLNDAQIEEILKGNLIGHMGCSANGVPYVIPICYAYSHGRIYGRTYEGKKLDMLRENANVCFQVENIENMLKWKSAICWGRFEELTDNDNRNEAVQVLQSRITAVIESDVLRQSLHWPFSITDQTSAKGIFFCIQVTKMTGRISNSA